MSVDQQIREGLVMLDQRLPTPDTSTTYEVIVREARTRTRRSRFLQGGLVAAAVLAVMATGRLGDALDPVPVPAPVDEPGIVAPSPSVVDGWEDLAGVWRTPPVSLEDMVDALRERGYRGDVEDSLRALLPEQLADPAGVPLTLTFVRGNATVRTADAAELLVHDQWYEVDDVATVTLHPYSAPGGRSRFAADLEDGTLVLSLMDTTAEPEGGVPTEVLLQALYTTAPFTWVGEDG